MNLMTPNSMEVSAENATRRPRHAARQRRRRWLTTLALSGVLLTSAGAVGLANAATNADQSMRAADATNRTDLDFVWPANPPGGWPAPGIGQGGWSNPYGGMSPYGGTNGSSTDDLDVTDATDEQEEGVVIIETVNGYANSTSAGTGIVLTSDGLILTNNHVIEGSTEISATVPSTGETYEATVVGTDARSDIAVIELEDASGLAVADLDDDGDPTVGDEVTAVGNAYGEGELVAADGTVTALDQTITAASAFGVAGQTLDNLIEIDADIVSGDSGGPLLDDEGDIVGINTAASDSYTMPVAAIQGSDITAYAIPIDHAMEIVDIILAGEETDTVTIGYPAFLGVQLATSDPGVPAGRYDGNGQEGTAQGAVIAGVIDGTPAAEAGLRAGDTVTAVDATTITSGDDLSEALDAHEPGDDVTITWTDTSGQNHTTTVTLAGGPAD